MTTTALRELLQRLTQRASSGDTAQLEGVDWERAKYRETLSDAEMRELLKVEQYLRERLEVLLTTTPEAVTVVPLLERWVALVASLPSALLDTHSIAPDPSSRVIEIESDALEPIGTRVLLTAALAWHLPQSHLILETVGRGGVVYFLEEIRNSVLPRWKGYHKSQAQNSEISAELSSTEQRLMEAHRVQNLFSMAQRTAWDDRLADRLMPCVLYILDDYAPRVATVGAQTVATIVHSASPECCQNWAQVLQKALSDRLASSDVTLWAELISVVCHFAEQCPTAQIPFLAKILKRLETDLAPYELAEVALGHLCRLVEGIGRPIVQFFSQLFPLMTQWLFSSQAPLQKASLDLMLVVITAGAERIPHHRDIILEILSAIESNSDGSSELMMQINAIKACLNEMQSTG